MKRTLCKTGLVLGIGPVGVQGKVLDGVIPVRPINGLDPLQVFDDVAGLLAHEHLEHIGVQWRVVQLRQMSERRGVQLQTQTNQLPRRLQFSTTFVGVSPVRNFLLPKYSERALRSSLPIISTSSCVCRPMPCRWMTF